MNSNSRTLTRVTLETKYPNDLQKRTEIRMPYNDIRYSRETDVRDSQFQQIDKNTFNGLTKLEKIILNDHLINYLDKDTFIGIF